jgi:hypothetical protein
MFIQEVFLSVADKYGMLFSPLVYDKNYFDQLKGIHPLFEYVKKEGVCLYGKKVNSPTQPLPIPEKMPLMQ